MTLRTRLVAALVALTTLGLAAFGIVTYRTYARSQYDRLDERLTAAAPLIGRALDWADRLAGTADGTGSADREGSGDGDGSADGEGEGSADGDGDGEGDDTDAGAGGRGPFGGGPFGGFRDRDPGTGTGFGARDGPGPPVVLPPGTYGERRAADGTVTPLALGEVGDATPDLPDDLAGREGPFTVGSTEGGTEWRVLVTDEPDGATSIVATPTTEVEAALDRLVLIEVLAGAGLLGVLAVGSWLILRRGLSPLERMAGTARSVTAGNLAQRVSPADGRTEVGQLGLALNTMLDDLERAFAERDATERRLRQFLADASHELRTPLTSIHGFAELFRLGGGAPDGPGGRIDLPVILRRIEQETERMQALVEDLLLLARLDRTREPGADPVDLAVLAADACTDAVAVDRSRKVTLAAPEPVVVHGDVDHLRQAIGNLVGNAIQHTPAGTPVDVAVRADGDRAVVEVRDHGPGLDQDAADHAFDRFWRADSARVGRGAGLGLSIVAAIADQHGGTAEAANAEGGGAVFTLHLPLPPS